MPRILVADDHDDARSVFSAVLRGATYEVFEAADGIETLELFHRHRPHVALVDIFMPGRDGVDVIRAMRAADPTVRILAVSAGWHLKLPSGTGGPHRDVLQDAWEAGADGTLSKPVDHRFLVAEVERLLRERPIEA